jgi:hypothetical protein
MGTVSHIQSQCHQFQCQQHFGVFHDKVSSTFHLFFCNTSFFGSAACICTWPAHGTRTGCRFADRSGLRLVFGSGPLTYIRASSEDDGGEVHSDMISCLASGPLWFLYRDILKKINTITRKRTNTKRYCSASADWYIRSCCREWKSSNFVDRLGFVQCITIGHEPIGGVVLPFIVEQQDSALDRR